MPICARDRSGAKECKRCPERKRFCRGTVLQNFHPKLLALAVEQKNLPDATQLNVLLFPGQEQSATTALTNLNHAGRRIVPHLVQPCSSDPR